MEEGPSQSTMTVAAPSPTNSSHVELQVLPISLSAATEHTLSGTNADLDDPEQDGEDAPLPLGVKLTGYRLLNIVVMFTIGVAKFILSLKSQSVTLTGLELAEGSVLAILLYCIGWYEEVESPRWRWFFHVDWAPGIGFGSKCFLGGVLRCLVSAWRFLPLILVMWIFLNCLPFFPDSFPLAFVGGFVSAFLGSFLSEALPKKWRVWQHIPVWAPVRRFFRRYASWPGDSAASQYRLIGNIGFCLGFLSGCVLSFEIGRVQGVVSRLILSLLS